jgi:hypothetical protein
MVVRDEAELLGDALESAREWVDELVVVDTGSTDRTVELAEAAGARVSHLDWPGHLATARNEAARRASGRWVLVLDADERIRGDDPAALRDQLERMATDHPWQVLSVEIVATGLGGEVRGRRRSVRVFPNDPRIGYRPGARDDFGALDPLLPRIHGHPYPGLGLIDVGDVPERRRRGARAWPVPESADSSRPEPSSEPSSGGLAPADPTDGLVDLGAVVARLRAEDVGDRAARLDSWRRLIGALRGEARTDAAVLGAAQQALDAFPRSADLWEAASAVLDRGGARDEAIGCLERALALLDEPSAREESLPRSDAERAVLLARLARWLDEAGRRAEAWSAVRRALAIGLEGRRHREAVARGLDLALSTGDLVGVDELLEHQLADDGASLDAFFAHLDRLSATEGQAVAVARLDTALARHPRVGADARAEAWLRRLGR